MNDNFNTEKAGKNFSDIALTIRELVDIVESSINLNERIEAIKKLNKIFFNFEKIGIDQETMFTLFENLLISDSNEKVREEAGKFLFQKYSNKALEPLRWALHHETSPSSLLIIFESLISIISNLEQITTLDSKALLIDLLNQIDDQDFKIEIAEYNRTKKLNSLNSYELGQILRNYFAHIYLKRRFWRVKYKIQHCKLIELDFIFKGLSHLPIAIKYLSSLKVLILRYNQITSLPPWIGELNSLEALNLNINNLTELPESIGNLINLKELLLWKNELREIPNTVGLLKNLIRLNLRLNQIEFLPPDFGKLSSLVDLNLHDNKLKSLPESFSQLKSLEKLNLSWNSLIVLPDSISNLINLKKLDLERNELKDLPGSIGKLSSLEYLNLRDNNLQDLPDSLSQLKHLISLNLSRNKLSCYPETIIDCPNLKEVYLGENNLSIPSEYEDQLKQRGITLHL